jgi:exopolysaccharide biosynthesis protein
VYDVKPPFNRSDFTYAAQNSPVLLRDGQVIARLRTDDGGIPWDYAFPRTAIGTNANGTVAWLVIADGEGVHGSSGATVNQLGEFFRDVLHATAAMNFDGGESTELILRGMHGPRRINRLTSENNAARPTYEPTGRVFNYLSAGQL